MIDPSIPLGVRPAQFNLGEMFGAMQGMQQLRSQGQQQRLQDIKLREADQAEASDNAIRLALQQHVGADGTPDYDAAAAKLESVGFGPEGQKLRKFKVEQQKAAEEAAKAALETEGKRYEIVGQRGGLAYNALSAAVTDPSKYPAARAQAIKLIPQAEEFLPAQFDKDKVTSAMTWWEATKPALETRAAVLADVREKAFQQKSEADRLAEFGGWMNRLLPTAQSQDEWDKALSLAPPDTRAKLVEAYGDTYSPEAAKRAAVVSMTPEKRAELAGQAESRALTAAGQKETATYHRAQLGLEAQRVANEEGSTPNLTPEALDVVANQFAMTGQLPPMGMGAKAAKMRSDVINRAAEMFKGLDIPTQQAAFKANRDSLVKMQGQRDAISAFEETAKKNMDVFLDAAGKVVDTGSPMANSLARHVTGKMLGSVDQAKYDAARSVLLPEIARIITNPSLTGVLSDNARKEVDEFNPQTATLAQTVAVMRLLKQDMGNRATSLDDGIAAIQKRIATPPGQRSRPAATDDAGGSVQLIDPSGTPRMVPADKVAEFLRRGGKRP